MGACWSHGKTRKCELRDLGLAIGGIPNPWCLMAARSILEERLSHGDGTFFSATSGMRRKAVTSLRVSHIWEIEGQEPVAIPALGTAPGTGTGSFRRAEGPVHSAALLTSDPPTQMDQAFSPRFMAVTKPRPLAWAGMEQALGPEDSRCEQGGGRVSAVQGG